VEGTRSPIFTGNLHSAHTLFFQFSSNSLSDSSYVLCCFEEVSIISDSLVSASSKVVTLPPHTQCIITLSLEGAT
jgi:hypothetical protein